MSQNTFRRKYAHYISGETIDAVRFLANVMFYVLYLLLQKNLVTQEDLDDMLETIGEAQERPHNEN